MEQNDLQGRELTACELRLPISCRCTPTGFRGRSGDLFTDQALNLTLEGCLGIYFLSIYPIQDIGIGLVVQLQFDLCGMKLIIQELLVNALLLF